MTESPNPYHVLIAGAGVAALEAALALRALAGELVSVELVAPETEFAYRPLSVAEPFRVADMRRFPLESLVEATGATLRKGIVANVDSEQKHVVLESGEALPYDAVLLALGARPQEAVPGAQIFRGAQDRADVVALLDQACLGDIRRLVFAVPAGTTWPLALYELALLTAEYLANRSTRGVDVSIVTPEDRPLGIFGGEASDAVRELLEIRGIRLETGLAPIAFHGGALHVGGGAAIPAEAVVALPSLIGPELDGVPRDGSGFVPVDEYGRVRGLPDVYAAGDMTQFPMKQGGLAAQQADAAALAIAAEVGATVALEPFRPILRGLLLTGFVPRYLRSDVVTGQSEIDTEPLWWPPAKVVGRYVAPFLGSVLGLEHALPEEAREGAIAVEIELEATDRVTSRT